MLVRTWLTGETVLLLLDITERPSGTVCLLTSNDLHSASHKRKGLLMPVAHFRLHPTYVHAMNNLGNILKEKNELIEAEQLLSKAVSIQYGSQYTFSFFVFTQTEKVPCSFYSSISAGRTLLQLG